MTQTSAGAGPIPPAKKDDSEDVAWALSTAEAMYARGDRGEALKWLRRAAESASEGEADDRALELAKAAADLASTISPTTSAPPPPPPPPPPPTTASRPPPPVVANPPPPAPLPPTAAAPASASSPPPPPAPAPPPPAPTVTPRVTASRPPPPVRSSSPPAAAKAPTPPAKPQGATPRPPTRAMSPFAPRPLEGRRAGRKSRPDISISRPPDEVTQSMATDQLPAPHPPEGRRARRASRPAAEETAPRTAVVTPQTEALPFPERETRPIDLSATAQTSTQTEEMDRWPTQSLLGDDLADPPDEKTRIGVPAYEASAKLATEATESSMTPLAPAVQLSQGPVIRSSQAIRVVVWRAADGVHVAPQGTRVAAISVDAVLVSLDPAADLAAWLSNK